MPQVIITAGARVGWKAAAASLQKRVPKQPGGPGRRSRANSGCCKTPQRLAARCRRNQSCGSWSSALGIPAMWRCTATSRMRVPFTYWPSGTRKKPGIERDHGSVLTTTPAARRRGGDSRCSEDAATRKQFATRCSGSFGKPSQKSEKPFEARRQTIFVSQLIRNFGFWVSISIALV